MSARKNDTSTPKCRANWRAKRSCFAETSTAVQVAPCFSELDRKLFYPKQAKTLSAVRKLYGDPDGMEELYAFWMPGHPVPDEAYEEIYRLIDEKVK